MSRINDQWFRVRYTINALKAHQSLSILMFGANTILGLVFGWLLAANRSMDYQILGYIILFFVIAFLLIVVFKVRDNYQMINQLEKEIDLLKQECEQGQ